MNGSRSTHQLRGSRNAPSPTRDPLALEPVGALDQPVVDRDRQAELGGDRLGGLLRALQRAGHDVGDVAVGERLRGRLGHLHAQLGEVEAGQPAVQDLVRVVDLAVPQHVHHRLSSLMRPPAAAAARAASRQRRGDRPPAPRRRAPPTRTTPRTRSAAGRRRAASIAWKNALNAADVLGLRARRSRRPRASVKKIENMLPAYDSRCGTPGRGQRVGGQLADRRGGLVEPRVDASSAQPQRGQPGGAGQRVTGQRAGLVDRAGRGEPAP